MEEKISTDNVEVCSIRSDTKNLVYKTKEEIQAGLDTLANWEKLTKYDKKIILRVLFLNEI